MPSHLENSVVAPRTAAYLDSRVQERVCATVRLQQQPAHDLHRRTSGLVSPSCICSPQPQAGVLPWLRASH